MGAREGEMKAQREAESALQSDQHHKNHPFSSIGRQSSIYSLTLDEFQHTLCESGKNFGSMNMDEFLSSIWNAEENQAINTAAAATNSTAGLCMSEASAEKGTIRKQPSLPRQGSLTLPAPLCRKTVDEVWSEIHKGRQNQQNQSSNGGASGDVQNTQSAPRQPTFGEMTLEDFLIKAGVVRESCTNTMPAQAQGQAQAPTHPQQQYGLYPNNNTTMGVGPSFVGRHLLAGNVVAPSYQAVPPGEPSSGYAGNGKRDNGYPTPSPGVCYGGRVVNGGGGYGAAPTMGVGGPVSPVSPDGLGTNENCGGQFGVEMGVLRGRKRIIDGPVEKVVERRQRRMIKNRESAARSRARKQAYTVELEAELNQLREENTHLKQALVELERRRKQQVLEESNMRVATKAQKAKEKLRALRRNASCPL